MNAAFAGKTPPPVAARFPNGSVKEVDVVECHLRPKYFCIELLAGHQVKKTKRLALMIVIVKTARSTKENK